MPERPKALGASLGGELPAKGTFQSIQLLRGVGSLLVVLFHASGICRTELRHDFLWNFFDFGGAGVDIFFTLSGFIIAYTSPKIHNPSENIRAFLAKRLVRIFPVYWIVITGFLATQLIFPSFYRNGYHFSANGLLGTYILLPGHQMVNGVSWSLTNELFFYALFMITFLLPYPKLLVCLIISFTIGIPLIWLSGSCPANADAWTSLLISPMNIEFFMGVVAAFIYKYIPWGAAKVLVLVGCILFLSSALISIYGVPINDQFFGRVCWFGIPSALIVTGLVGLEHKRTLNIHGYLRKLGDASYSLYLLHLPLLAASIKLVRVSGSNQLLHQFAILSLVVIITIMALIFYYQIERPLVLLLGKWIKRKPGYPLVR